MIVELECSLVGHEGPIRYTPGTRIAAIAGVEQSVERYHCSYGISPAYIEQLAQAGVIFGAHDQDGAPRSLELDDHPFFLGTLFQPELAGDGTRAHPVIRAFAGAVVSRRARRDRVTRAFSSGTSPREARSLSVITPASVPPLTTTSRRTPWRIIRSPASSTSMSGSAVITGEEAWSVTLSSGERPSPTTDRAMSRSVMNPTGRPRSTSTTEPTLRSRMRQAISRTDASGEAVTSDSVMTSRTSTAGESTIAPPWPTAAGNNLRTSAASSRCCASSRPR